MHLVRLGQRRPQEGPELAVLPVVVPEAPGSPVPQYRMAAVIRMTIARILYDRKSRFFDMILFLPVLL